MQRAAQRANRQPGAMSRTFIDLHRGSDIKRHKCLVVMKPLSEQHGTVHAQFPACEKWLCSSRGFTVHILLS